MNHHDDPYPDESAFANAQPVQPGDVLTLQVERLGDDGDGLCRVQNYVIWVPGALAGGRLTVEVRIGQQDWLIRSLRLEGAILAADSPDMVRLLQLSEFNAPVTIEPPQ